MRKICSVAILWLWMVPGVGVGQDLSGMYTLSSQGTVVTLTLEQDAQGNIKGALSSTTGAEFRVEGMIQGTVGRGTCTDKQGRSYFEAYLKGNKLLFSMIESDRNNMPDYTKVKQLTLTRKRETTAAQQGQKAASKHRGGLPQASPQAPAGTADSLALSKDEVSDPHWGFAFSLPKGWKVEKGPQGAILGHDAIAGMIWVFPHLASTVREVQTQMQMGLVEHDVQLQLTSQLQSLGNNTLVGMYSGVYQRQQVKARGIGTFSPEGGGAYIVAMALPNEFGLDLANAADTLAKSVRHSGARELAGSVESDEAAVAAGSSGQTLMRQMAGVYYSFSSAGPSYSGGTERRVTLCPDGTYDSGSESSYSAGAGTGGAWGTANRKFGRGTWRVRGNINEGTLTTIDSSGKATEYRYQRCGGDCIYFGNNKFAIAEPASCP